jgi:hypothetical protein
MLEFCFNPQSFSGGKPVRSVCSMQQALATAVPISAVSLSCQNFVSLRHLVIACLRVDRAVVAKEKILPGHMKLSKSKKQLV